MIKHVTKAACVAALLATIPACSRASDTDGVARALADQLAIQQLVSADYSMAVDTGDGDALAALFTPDGDFQLISPKFPPKIYKGRAEIQKAFSMPVGAPPPPPSDAGGGGPGAMPLSVKHVITNVKVTVQNDTAKAVSYYIEVARLPGDKSSFGAGGYYEDELKRVGGRWLISRRLVHDSDLPKKAATP